MTSSVMMGVRIQRAFDGPWRDLAADRDKHERGLRIAAPVFSGWRSSAFHSSVHDDRPTSRDELAASHVTSFRAIDGGGAKPQRQTERRLRVDTSSTDEAHADEKGHQEARRAHHGSETDRHGAQSDEPGLVRPGLMHAREHPEHHKRARIRMLQPRPRSARRAPIRPKQSCRALGNKIEDGHPLSVRAEH